MVVPMNRRSMMLMTGIGVLAAAIPVPEARAYPSPPDAPAGPVPPPAAPGNSAQGTYLFHDEFDGPAGSAPD
ncbi:MAG: 1,3-beta-glucanase, partial [Mycobacterium sp.]